MAYKNLKQLFESGYVELARLPEKNEVSLEDLDKLDGYTVPIISHDYSAKTPKMWNSLYEHLGLNIRNIMVVANPENASEVISALRQDEKYLGGGFGVGWKEKLEYLDEISPSDLSAVNIVVKEQGKLVGYNTDSLGFVKSLEDKFDSLGKPIEGSNFILLGAGGVAKEVAREIAIRKAGRIVILNRSYDKAVSIANELNRDFGKIASAGGEEIIRGYLLNSFLVPDAVLNLSDKGSDGKLENYSAFAPADLNSSSGEGFNNTVSRTICSELSKLNPGIIIADIIISKKGKSKTLSIAENAGLENLIDGIPMVVNQAAPAYCLVQKASPLIHSRKVSEQESLDFFRKVANN